MLALFGIVLIVLGVVSLVKRDWMWTLTRIGNEMDGQVSRRSDLWDIKTVVAGVLLIVFGIIFLLIPGGPRR